MSGETIKVTPEQISAARALVAIKGEDHVSAAIAALARVRPGYPVHLRGERIDEDEPVESAS